jgi:hypothetical protein
MDISSSNAVLSLSAAGLIPAPVVIKGWSTDDAFDIEDIKTAEVMMGIDGRLSAGWVFEPIPMGLVLQADSPSVGFFETLYANEKAQQKKYFLNGTVLVPSLGSLYTFTNGVIETYSGMSSGKKVMQPRHFGIKWEAITPGAPMGVTA